MLLYLEFFFHFSFSSLTRSSARTYLLWLFCCAGSCCHSNSVLVAKVRRCSPVEDDEDGNLWRSNKVLAVPGLKRCIRDPQAVHLTAERHCLFSQCLTLACSARLLTTTIVFGAGIPREASCLPVLWTELPVWTKGGVGHLFISHSAWKEVRETFLMQQVHYDLWLLLACIWCQG